MHPPYKMTIPFRDIDMHGHMHNAAHVSHFEAALSHHLRVWGVEGFFDPASATVFVVRGIELGFQAPTTYGENVEIACKIAKIGRTSLTFQGVMTAGDQTRATAQIVWISFDKAAQSSAALSEDLVKKLTPFLA